MNVYLGNEEATETDVITSNIKAVTVVCCISFAYSLTHSLTNPLTHLLTHLLTHSLTHSFTHSPTYSLTRCHSLMMCVMHVVFQVQLLTEADAQGWDGTWILSEVAIASYKDIAEEVLGGRGVRVRVLV